MNYSSKEISYIMHDVELTNEIYQAVRKKKIRKIKRTIHKYFIKTITFVAGLIVMLTLMIDDIEFGWGIVVWFGMFLLSIGWLYMWADANGYVERGK